MSNLMPTLFVIAIAFFPSPSLAHESDACLPGEDMSTPVCYHYFENRHIELPIRQALDRIATSCEQLVVRVLQRQGLTLAELGEPLQLEGRDCPTMTSISLTLPDIRSETDILVQFVPSASMSGQGDEPHDAAAVIALRVYPDTLLDPLLRYAEQHSLVVFDDDGLLTEFLDTNEIEYVRSFEAVTGTPIGLLVQQGEPERLLEDRGIDTAIIFQEKIVDLPQVRSVSIDGRTRVYVEMPFLHDLNENPLAQKALLNIVRLATNPYPNDRG